ncbi:MAG: Alpha-1,3-mannosyltransferase-like protein [Pycnora praestabilis]|nr:MAG: Alpha-1,3-mannosyltransferase-like protein [Pycnora praestabilis]
MSKKTNIVFFHPDLGIGGAERLVIDAAVGLQNRSHKITIFTSYCDPQHCFDEVRDGTLDVRVRGDTIFPPSILNRFSILCAIFRQLHLVVQISLSGELAALKPDVFFIDQLSACIPLLRLIHGETWTVFYCHFPDKLLAHRDSLLKRTYRIPFDWWESWTTGLTDSILVNSNFTSGVFKQAFPSLSERTLRVVYPCVNPKEEKGDGTLELGDGKPLWSGKKVLLSINRFERKKDVGLAIKAFAGLAEKERMGVRLVVAGGYDNRLQENVTCHNELVSLADSLGLSSATTKNIVTALNIPDDINVLFLLSVPASLKSMLLRTAQLLIYTPSHEHFGIVPLEAMLAGVPVLAANAGGPLETVQDGMTGWLRSVDDVEQWTKVMRTVLHETSKQELQNMAEAGKRRVKEDFSQEKMAERLDDEVQKLVRKKKDIGLMLRDVGMFVMMLGIIGLLAAFFFTSLFDF